MKTKQEPHLVLASSSPRRRELLSQMGIVFVVDPAECDERVFPNESPTAYTQRMAEDKSRIVGSRHPDFWVLGADTVVVHDDVILGKPSDETEARNMLAFLGGATHCVITSFGLSHGSLGKMHIRSVETKVEFKQVTPAEIRAYVRTREPMDKAGAYAVQGLGAFMVRGIYGSYSNVVGLPLTETIESLIELDVIPGFPIDNGEF